VIAIRYPFRHNIPSGTSFNVSVCPAMCSYNNKQQSYRRNGGFYNTKKNVMKI